MKKYILTIVLFIIAAFNLGPKTCLAETENNSINISYQYGNGFCDDLNQFSIEYEYLLKNSRISLFGRYNTANYSIDDTGPGWFSTIGEDGNFKGFDFGFRFFPIGQKRMDKLFIGGAFGFFQSNWKKNSYGYEQETYSENVTRLDTEIGYRFNTKSKRVSITPSAHLGYYFRDRNSILDLGIYSGISISVGFVF
jgi:hypothetical protein